MATLGASAKVGERYLPNIVDERAASGYDRPVAMFPKSKYFTAGFRTVSYAQLANAVNRACWWLEETMPSSEEKAGTFAYFGPNDLRYLIFVIATMKTGRKILIASLRNPIQAQLELFKRTTCKVIISCQTLNPSLEPLFAASRARTVDAPQLDDILADQSVPHYAYVAVPLDSAANNFLILHTSGSSGNPKPITWTHEFVRLADAGNILPTEEGESLTKLTIHHQNALSLLPYFHAGGLAYTMFAVFYEMTLVQGHPNVPMTAEYVAQLLKSGMVTTLLSPPSILKDLADAPSAQDDLAKVKHIGYVGGPLGLATGQKLAKMVPHLFSYLGATECGFFHMLPGSNEVWDSLKFFSDVGYRFEEISAGISELVVVKDDRTNVFNPVFLIFPELSEYRTKDLYVANTETPGWWKYRGRTDDLIVLSNGEKINPLPMEHIISAHPSLKAALVIGEYRFMPSLLVETNSESFPSTESERHQLLDNIWPTVQEANKIVPGFSKIPKSLILFTDPKKPFLRAGKGTIQRQLTVRAYAEELERLYNSQEAGILSKGLTLTKSPSHVDIVTFVREIYGDAMEADDLHDTENVFQRGLDSLGVVIIVQRLRAALRVCEVPINPNDINPRLVYSTWSVERMADVIHGLANIQNGGVASTKSSRETELRSMLESHLKNLLPVQPLAQSDTAPATSAPWTVILTGTTGSLGSYLLAHLEALPVSQVSKIYCLNRSSDARKQQVKSNLARGLNAEWDNTGNDRVEFLQARFAEPDLGLGEIKFNELLREATVVIHGAWKVDFNLTLESFEPQVQGVRNLLDFGAKSAKKAPLIFISSISTALNYLDGNPSKMVPESIIQDFEAPERLGYGESKFVSEHLLDSYSKATGLTTAVFRTGQIAGPLTDKGAWNKQEWFPSLVASSKHLGALPETLGNMEVLDWIPVDVLSSIMVELKKKVVAQQDQVKDQTSVYNLVNPRAAKWSEVRQEVQKFAKIEKSVPLKEWVSLLEQSSHEKNGAVLGANPAVKLLDFFEMLSEREPETKSRFDVDKLVNGSSTAAELSAVSAEWLRLWIRQWNL